MWIKEERVCREEEGTQACQGTCTHLDVAKKSCEMGKKQEEKLEGGRQQVTHEYCIVTSEERNVCYQICI